MKKIFSFFVFFALLLLISSGLTAPSYAADIRANNTIIIPQDEKNLHDLYLFGRTIEVGAPVQNDLVAAGSDIVVDNSVSGNILAAGGNLRLKGDSAGSVRIAGGNIIIDGKVGRDLLIGGGSVTITKSATIAGDLIIAGGDLTVQGTVNGKALINGGQARIDGTVKKQVEANIGKLTLGPNSMIGGDLKYSSPEKAALENGAVVKGTQHFTRVEQPKRAERQAGEFFRTISIYKLISDIIISIALIYFLGGFLRHILTSLEKDPVLNGVFGLAFIIVMPVVSAILLILLWLGIGSFLFYFLILLIAIYIAKIFLGWFLVRWWYSRDKKNYNLDWKAGIIGPIALFLIGLIPVIGWLFIAVLYLISTGVLIRELAAVIQTRQPTVRLKK